MALTFTQSHRLQESCNLCSFSVGKWHEVAQTFVGVDCDCQKNQTCNIGDYGSFEHLLFLFENAVLERQIMD